MSKKIMKTLTKIINESCKFIEAFGKANNGRYLIHK